MQALCEWDLFVGAGRETRIKVGATHRVGGMNCRIAYIGLKSQVWIGCRGSGSRLRVSDVRSRASTPCCHISLNSRSPAVGTAQDGGICSIPFTGSCVRQSRGLPLQENKSCWRFRVARCENLQS